MTKAKVEPQALQLAQILEDARDLMNGEGGKHWIKKAFRSREPQGTCYCALGAIEAVAGYKKNDSIRGYAGPRKTAGALAARALSLAIAPRLACRWHVTSWNDSPARTWKQVDAAFRKAARAASVRRGRYRRPETREALVLSWTS